jgi:hypothetical protein
LSPAACRTLNVRNGSRANVRREGLERFESGRFWPADEPLPSTPGPQISNRWPENRKPLITEPKFGSIWYISLRCGLDGSKVSVSLDDLVTDQTIRFQVQQSEQQHGTLTIAPRAETPDETYRAPLLLRCARPLLLIC